MLGGAEGAGVVKEKEHAGPPTAVLTPERIMQKILDSTASYPKYLHSSVTYPKSFSFERHTKDFGSSTFECKRFFILTSAADSRRTMQNLFAF